MSSAKTDKTTQNAPANATATAPSPPSLSAEVIAQNEDLRNEILVRLPIKSLMRFQSVSKPWLAHITSPNLSRSREAFYKGSISGLIMKRASPLASVRGAPEFDFFNLGGKRSAVSSRAPFNSRLTLTKTGDSAIGILQSTSGLLLCTRILNESYIHSPVVPKEYYIYNPATKKFTELPPNISPYSTLMGFSLAFDPSQSPYYKVVCICNDKMRDPTKHWIEIYSSETRRWRPSTTGTFRTKRFTVQFDGGVYWNGAIHWFSMNGTLFYFKIDDERMRRRRMAPMTRKSRPYPSKRYFGESGGRMHLVDHIEDGDSPYFDVFEMAEDCSGWNPKFRVDLSVLRGRSGGEVPEEFVYFVVSVVRCEPEEESFIVLQLLDEAVRYNFKTKAIDKIYGAEERSLDLTWYLMLSCFAELGAWPDGIHQYVETLAAV